MPRMISGHKGICNGCGRRPDAAGSLPVPSLERTIKVAMLTHQPEIIPVLFRKVLKIKTSCLGDEINISGLFTENVIGRPIVFCSIEFRTLIPITAVRLHEGGIIVAIRLVTVCESAR